MLDPPAIGMQTKPAGEATSDENPEDPSNAQQRGDVTSDTGHCPSPVLSPTNPSTNANAESIAASIAPSIAPQRPSLDTLAHTLSRQDLRLGGPVSVSTRPSSPPALSLPDVSHPQPGSTLEPDHAPRLDNSSLLGRRDLDPLTLPPAAALPSPMDTDDPFVFNSRTLRRQQSSGLGTTEPSSSRATQSLVESMISSGSQCNVHSAPLPTPTSATQRGPIIEPPRNISLDLSCVGLEVDEAYCEGKEPDDEELAWIENIISLRRARSPGGIRKHGLLRYRPSADVGLRCANAVRNRPRMRKRPKLGPNSKASSVVSSAISSPIIPPSIPDDHLF